MESFIDVHWNDHILTRSHKYHWSYQHFFGIFGDLELSRCIPLLVHTRIGGHFAIAVLLTVLDTGLMLHELSILFFEVFCDLSIVTLHTLLDR